MLLERCDEDEGARKPIVDGRIIESESAAAVDTTYWVKARGGGEIR